MPESTKAQRVFISYSQESAEHAKWVNALAGRLRGGGVDAWIDQYEAFPMNGWRAWMNAELEKADWVLVVCTKEYKKRFDGNAPTGSGVRYESMHITQQLYDNKFKDCDFVPVLPPGEVEATIPWQLRDYTSFALDGDFKQEGYVALHGLLTGQHLTPAPPLEIPMAAPATPYCDEAEEDRNGLPPVRRVLIGKCTKDLDQARDDLVAALKKIPSVMVDGESLTLDLLADYENDGDLEVVMRPADYLVIPVSNARPYLPIHKPAGHLTIQKDEWERLEKYNQIIWYRPDLASGPLLAGDDGRTFIASLPCVRTITQITAQLDPPKNTAMMSAYIYIEGGKDEKDGGKDDQAGREKAEPNAWKILGKKISEVWRNMEFANMETPVNLHLYYRRLDIDRLEPLPERIDAIVLLLGAKPTTTLLSNINKIETVCWRKRGSVLPGLVAELIPPRSESESDKEPKNDWDFTRFRNNASTRHGYRIDDSDLSVLEDFLKDVREDVIERGQAHEQ